MPTILFFQDDDLDLESFGKKKKKKKRGGEMATEGDDKGDDNKENGKISSCSLTYFLTGGCFAEPRVMVSTNQIYES